MASQRSLNQRMNEQHHDNILEFLILESLATTAQLKCIYSYLWLSSTCLQLLTNWLQSRKTRSKIKMSRTVPPFLCRAKLWIWYAGQIYRWVHLCLPRRLFPLRANCKIAAGCFWRTQWRSKDDEKFCHLSDSKGNHRNFLRGSSTPACIN